MFQVFDSKGRKRAINLGGASKSSTDKDQLLKQAAQERAARESERLKFRAILRIQAFVRGRKDVANVKERLRQDWDRALTFLEAGSAPPDAVVGLVRRLLFVYHPFKDFARIDALCTYLVAPADSARPPATSRLFAQWESDSAPMWTHQVKRLCKLCLKRLLVNSGTSESRQDQPNSFIAFLQCALNKDAYLKLQARRPPSKFDPLATFSDLVTSLVAGSYHHDLRNLILAFPPESKSHAALVWAVSLATIPFGLLSSGASPLATQDLVFPQFCTQILTIPILPNRIPLASVTHLASHFPFDHATHWMTGHWGQVQAKIASLTEPVPSAALLGNLIAFGKSRLGVMSPENLEAYVCLVAHLLTCIPPSYLGSSRSRQHPALNITGDSDDDDPIDDMTVAPPSMPSFGAPDPRLLKWLTSLCEPAHLSLLVRPLVESFASFASASHFLMALCRTWPEKKDEILAAVTYHFSFSLPASLSQRQSRVNFVNGGWLYLQSCTSDWYQRMSRRDGVLDLVVQSHRYPQEWTILSSMTQVYSKLLATMGDDEFFASDKNLLTLDQVKDLSTVLRNIVVEIIWNEAALPADFTLGAAESDPTSSRLPLKDLRVLFIKLCQQIHARDSRRSFCPPGHWLLPPSFDIESFIMQVVSEEESQDPEASSAALGPPSPSRPFSTKQTLVTPRHSLLRSIPFVIPFTSRINIFREFVRLDKHRLGLDTFIRNITPIAQVSINRSSVFEDGYTYLNGLGEKLKGRIAITFVSELGGVEAGIDGGGVFKEFLTELSKQAFNPNFGLFQVTVDQLLYPSPHSYARQELQLRLFEFLGRIIGKAMYEGILMSGAFAGFFLAKWLGRQSYLDDLPSLDPELYHGLIQLKHYSGDIENDLGLTFSISDQEFGETTTIDLVPNGSNIPVTAANRIRYIFLVAHYKLNLRIDKQCRAFFRGLSDMIQPKWLRMFNQQELLLLLCGSQESLNVSDLKRHITYDGVFSEAHPTIQSFWKVVDGMSADEKRKFLKFVTACERAPLLGFDELQPKFCVRCSGDEQDRLPTASTCINLLKMPAYTNERLLREKLLYAINANVGFELS